MNLDQLTNLIDPCSMGIVAIALFWGANAVCAGRPGALQMARRAGVFVFLAVLTLRWAEGEMTDPDRSLATVVQAGVVGFFVTGLAGIVFPCVAWLYSTFVAAPGRYTKSQYRRYCTWRERRSAVRRERKATANAEAERQRTRPDRERAARDVAARREREAAAALERESIRFEVQVLYDRHRAEVADKLPEDVLTAYFREFLTDELPVDQFRLRAERLRDLILGRAHDDGQTPAFDSFEAAMAHFDGMLSEIHGLGLDTDHTQSLVVLIETAREKAIEELLS